VSSERSDRCGHRLEVGQIEDGFPSDPCERPVWENHDRDEDYEKCIWHVPIDGKTVEMIEEAESEPEEGGNFNGAYLKGAELLNASWFQGASLIGAELSEANVKGVDFEDADLTLATLRNLNALGADFEGANLEGATLMNADLRRATLDDARLHEAVLTDAHIAGGTSMGNVNFYDLQDAPPDLVESQPLEAAAWVYRQLQKLYRDNGLALLARRSYYLEKDARRRLSWKQGKYADAIKRELSRWVMRYGDSPYRVLLTGLAVIVFFAIMYPLTGGIMETQGEQSLTYQIKNPEEAPQWWLARVMLKSLYFSAVTFTTLGYGDIQPIGAWARFMAGIEALLGSMLAALLVFVLSRLVTW